MQPASTVETLKMIQQQLVTLELEAHQARLPFGFVVMALKRQLFVAALERAGGNKCKAAQALGMHRNTLNRNLAELKIDPRAARSGPQSVHSVANERRQA